MQTPEQSSLGQSGDEQSLPFDQQGRKTGGSLVPASEELPPGTLITVRLEQAISSHSSRVGERFQGVVDEPVLVDGRTLVPRGTKVEGTVLAARASDHLRDPGYIRLALSSLLMGGDPVSVTTNSIFAKARLQGKRSTRPVGVGPASGDPPQGNNGLHGAALEPAAQTANVGEQDVHFSVERRLTFRLTQAVSLKN